MVFIKHIFKCDLRCIFCLQWLQSLKNACLECHFQRPLAWFCAHSNQGFLYSFYAVCLFLFFAIWIFYTIYSGIWTRLYLTEFILFVTTDSAVVAQVVSCYEGRHGWNRCQRKIFFIFFHHCLKLICPIQYSFALLKTASFLTGLNLSPQHFGF